MLIASINMLLVTICQCTITNSLVWTDLLWGNLSLSDIKDIKHLIKILIFILSFIKRGLWGGYAIILKLVNYIKGQCGGCVN